MPAPRKRPDWHWHALALHSKDLTREQIAAQVGKALHTVDKVLYSPWGKEQRREIAARVSEATLKEAVDPIVKFQAKGARMADIMLQAAEDETQPLKKALIAEKNLALGGWVAIQKSMSLSVEAKIRDREALPDHLLEAFANGGEIPDQLKGLLAVETENDPG